MGSIVRVFHSAILNKPGAFFEGRSSQKGRIQNHFMMMNKFVSIVFMEVEPLMAMGRSQENVIGQLLAECVGMCCCCY